MDSHGRASLQFSTQSLSCFNLHMKTFAYNLSSFFALKLQGGIKVVKIVEKKYLLIHNTSSNLILLHIIQVFTNQA